MGNSARAFRDRLIGSGWAFALFCLVLGVRLFVFDYAGSPLPYYDQWLAEFNNTFAQLVQGAPVLDVLMVRHNEHLMVTVKAMSVVGFVLNGYWDVAFLAAVGALVRAIEAVLLLRLLTTGAARTGRVVAWCACAAVFVAPVSGFNLLCGLQVSFYFAELAAIGAIACVVGWRGPWRSGTALVLITAFGLISMGSAIAIPLATAATHLATRQKRRGFWPAWGVTAAAAVAFASLMATTRADGIPLTTKVWFGLEILAWPFSSAAIGGVVIVLTVTAILWAFRRGVLQRGALPAVVGFGVFAATNALLIAANRPPSDFHLRHWETVALVPLTLAVLIANLLPAFGSVRKHLTYVTAAAAVAYTAVFGVRVTRQSWSYIEGARAHRAEALTYYQRLLRSPRVMTEAQRINDMLRRQDYRFFDDPVLRFTPHPRTFMAIASAPRVLLPILSPEIFAWRSPSALSIAVHRTMADGLYIAALGALAALASAVLMITGGRPRRAGPPADEVSAEPIESRG